MPELSASRPPAKRVHVFVSGRVQGVFFRVHCEHLARDRGLGGFVRNLPDGRVEAAFDGPERDVDAMVEWCHEGPAGARVEHVQVVRERSRGDTEFRVTR